MSPSPSRSARRGFTLIEMLIAMAIITFGLLVILGMFVATLLVAQRTEIDLVTDVAYANAVHDTALPEFGPELLGNLAPPIPPGDEFAYADEFNGLVKHSHADYAVPVQFGSIGITQWFSQRPVFDAVNPPPPGALPGEIGLRYVTVHTGQIDQRGAYTGSPHQGEELNEFVLIGVTADANNN